MAKCAVVDLDTNIVMNIIVAEPTDLPPENSMLVEIKKIPVDVSMLVGIPPEHPLVKEGVDQPAHIGWQWTGTEFVEVK
jgi:hypothetical protein